MGRGVAWDVVAREVRTTLRARQVSADTADEVTQETLWRALSRERGEDAWSTRDAVCWGVRVALNLAVDERRHAARVRVGEVPDMAATIDVEGHVVARLELEAVAGALPRLSENDRRLLLDVDRPAPATRREQTRAAVARHRARERLRDLTGSAWAWVGSSTPARRVVDASAGARDAVSAMAAAVVITAAAQGGPIVVPVVPPAANSASSWETWTHGESTSVGGGLVAAAVRAAAGAGVDEERPDLRANEPAAERRPAWTRPGQGPERARVDVNGERRPGAILVWEDDPEADDDPLLCEWSAASGEICTPATWGDVRDVAPVAVPGTPF